MAENMTETTRATGEMHANVAPLSDAVAGSLTYQVPIAFQTKIKVGVAVIVPLRNRLVAGIVVSLSDAQPSVVAPPSQFVLKAVHSIVDEKPALNKDQLKLARWMSMEYCAHLGRCCALMIPPGYTPSSAYLFTLALDMQQMETQPTTDVRSKIIAVLKTKGAQTESRLKIALRKEKYWRSALQMLVDEGKIIRSSTLEPVAVKPQRTTMVQMVISDMTLEIVRENITLEASIHERRAVSLNRRLAVLDYLQKHNRLAWAEWIYAETGANRVDLEWLVARDYITLGDAERWRDPLSDIDYVVSSPPSLTSDQSRAWDAVRLAMEHDEIIRSASRNSKKHAHFLLRGVTGSGKTEVYMRAVDLILQRNQSALVLVPEISLTPQTARRFLSRFPGKVALIHSRLKPGERYDTWRRIRSGELPVVVGARSALFSPVPRLGLIIIDEEHDQSYKQSSPPYYDARRVALKYAASTDATVILGSATPSLETWRMTQEGQLELLDLPNRVRSNAHRVADQAERLGVKPAAMPETETVLYQPMPEVRVIDMRAELRGGNMSMFSGALTIALTETLRRREQAIIFLNRRGSASCVVCRDCGYAMRCPNDDTPLTYHQPLEDGNTKVKRESAPSSLKCHTCNHAERVPAQCPTCGSPRIRFIGIGTQKVEQAIHEQFPHARVVRWDKDSSMAGGRTGADHMLQRFANQQADVLVGTQMIAKGLDLPMVTLVGVVLADVGLFLPDFRASERVFDLIEQVAGRAGRSLLTGKVIVQTYNPEHPAVSYAATHDVTGYAKYESAQRRMLNLPPYTRLVRFEFDHEDNAKARLDCEMLARILRRRVPQASDVIGPSQAYFARRANRFRWQVFVRTLSPRSLLDGMQIPRECVVDVDPTNML